MICLVKRIVISGSRNYLNYYEAKEYIDYVTKDLMKKYNLIFISGTCKGADALGERYAKENNYKIEYYPAQWEKYGKKAGPIRNRQMAEVADYIICFWDGKSLDTKSMIKYSKEINKPLRIKIIYSIT